MRLLVGERICVADVVFELYVTKRTI